MERPKAAAHQSWLGLAGLAWSWKLWCQMLKKKKEVKLKAHDERLLEPSKGEKKKKEKKTFVTTWLLIYWFPGSIFFIQGCFERAKQSLSLLAVVVFPRQMDTRKHTLEHRHTADARRTQTHTREQTHGAPSGGGVFNPQIHCHKSNPAPSCPGSSLSMKSSSQWHINSNLQGRSCEEGSINRASFYFVVPYYFHSPRSQWIGNCRRRALLHHSLWLDVGHVTPFFPTIAQ